MPRFRLTSLLFAFTMALAASAVSTWRADAAPAPVAPPSLTQLHDFTLPAQIRCATMPNFAENHSSPAVADLFGDGRKEVVFAWPDGNVWAWYGDNFALVPGWPRNAGANVSASPTIAVLDGDTLPSVIVSSFSGQVHVWDRSGNERPGWPRSTLFGTSVVQPAIFSSVAVGDAFGDGRRELFVTGLDHHTYAWFSNGVPLPGWPKQIADTGLATPALADLQHNGTLSIVTPHDASGLYGVWGGIYSAWGADGSQLWVRGFDEVPWASPAIADFGDGNYVTVNGTGHFYHQTRNAANGKYIVGLNQDGTDHFGFPLPTNDVNFASPAVGDLFGDGGREIVEVTEAGTLYATYGNGAPVAGFPRTVPDLHTFSGGVAIAPVDSSGRNGIYAATGFGVAIYSMTDTANPTVVRPTAYVNGTTTPENPAPSPYGTPTIADLGGGHLSLILATSTGAQSCGATSHYHVTVFAVNNTNPASLGASAWPTFHGNMQRTGSNIPPTIIAANVGDYNGDGKAEVAAIRRTSADVLVSTGSAFGAPAQWSAGAFFGTRATLNGDVSGDRKTDLLAVNQGSTWVMRSTGSGFSGPEQWSNSPFYGSRATLVADVNGDGKADLVAVNDGSTWVMLSTGSGFSAPQPWSGNAFYGSRATSVADVNGDGKADLVAVNDGSTWVMLSSGSGFSAPQPWSGDAFYGSHATLIGDINGDGKADLVAVNGGNTFVMLSSGSSFAAPQAWSTTPFYGNRATLIADVTGDGKADLVAVNDVSIWVMSSNGSSYGGPTPWRSGTL